MPSLLTFTSGAIFASLFLLRRCLSYFFFIFLIFSGPASFAEDKSGSKQGLVKLPQAGGTVQGESARFNINANKGASQYSLPLPPLPSRSNIAPSISLDYSQFSPDSGLGMGWQFSLPSIEVSSELGVPLPGFLSSGEFRNYLTFMGEKLIFIRKSGGQLQYKLESAQQDLQVIYHASKYTPSHGHTINGAKPFINSGFEVIYTNGTRLLFSGDLSEAEGLAGTTAATDTIARFPLVFEVSAQGEGIQYLYEKYQGNSYLSDIYFAGGKSHYAFEFSERDQPVKTYQKGFEQIFSRRYSKLVAEFDGIVQGQVCFAFSTRHSQSNQLVINSHADCQSLAEQNLNSKLDHHSLTQLDQLRAMYRYGKDSALNANTERLPTVYFDYSSWSKSGLTQRDLIYPLIELEQQSQFVANDFELADINHDGLVDVLRRNANNSSEVFLGEGDQSLFSAPQSWQIKRGSKVIAVDMRGNNFHFADMNGDTYVDILEFDGITAYIYLGQASGGFTWTGQAVGLTSDGSIGASSFTNGFSRIVDINNDGKSDIITTFNGQFKLYLNLSEQNNQGSWLFNFSPKTFNTPAQHGEFLLSDSQVKILDVNGDQLPDLIKLHASSQANASGICVYQNIGNLYQTNSGGLLFGDASISDVHCGAGGEFVLLKGLQGVDSLNGLWLGDVNGDGILDFVSIGTVKTDLLVWVGRGNLTLSDPLVLNVNLPLSINYNDSSRSRMADIDGDGQVEILIFDEQASAGQKILMIDFNREDDQQLIKSNLLTHVEFESGLRHDIRYATSTDERIRDIQQGQPTSPLHFPVVVAKQLISSTGASGQLRSNVQVQEYFYHQPFYSTVDKSFSGFAQVEVLNYGDEYAQQSHLIQESYYPAGTDTETQALTGQLISRKVYSLKDDDEFNWLAIDNTQLDPNQSALHSLSKATRQQGLPQLDKLLNEQKNQWIAVDKNKYFHLRQVQQDNFQYSAGSDNTEPRHQKILFEGFDQYNIAHKRTETLESINGPFDIAMPSTTTITEWDFSGARGQLQNLGIVDAADYEFVLRNDEVLSFNLFSYDGSGLVQTDSRYNLSSLTNLPAELQGSHQAEYDQVIEYSRDEYGNITGITDNLGELETVGYDSDGIQPTVYTKSGNQNWQFEYDQGKLARFQSPLGLWTSIEYDNLGRKVRNVSIDGAEQLFHYKQGFNGNPSMVLTELRRYASAAQTPSGEQTWIKQLAAFNADGTELAQLEESETVASSGSTGVRIKSYSEYNRNKLKVFQWTPYQIPLLTLEDVFYHSSNIPEPADRTGKAFTHDALARIKSVSFPSGKSQSFNYYSWGQQQTSFYQSGANNIEFNHFQVGNGIGVYASIEQNGLVGEAHITRFGRDVLGQLSFILLPGESQRRELTYDNQGRLEFQKLPGLGERYYFYDERGRQTVVGRISEDGKLTQVIKHEYDEADRLMSTSLDGKPYADYQYDNYSQPFSTEPNYLTPINQAQGMLTRVTTYDHNGFYDVSQQLGYDLQGRTIHQEVTLAGKTLAESYKFTLDGTGTHTTNPHGLEGIYSLGRDQNLKSVAITLPGETSVIQVIDDMAYNGHGQIEQIRYRQLDQQYSQTNLNYDPNTLQMTHIESYYMTDSGSVTLQDLAIELDQNQSILSITDAVGSTQYGHIDRSASFTYNWKDELVSADRYGKQHRYEYSEGGSFSLNSELGDGPIVVSNASNLIPQGVEQEEYQFDGFGQLKRSPQILDARYNALGQLVHAQTSRHDIYYGYNQSGIRTYKKLIDRVDTQQVKDSLYPMPSIAFEPSGAQSYLYVADSRLVRLEHETGAWFYYLKDHLGSSDIVMGANGIPVEQMLYHAYGNEEKPEELSVDWAQHLEENAGNLPTEKTHHRFTGQYLDDETGLYDYGQRYYDPKLGRFISPDPLYLNDPQQCLSSARECNLYMYALNNPLKFIDPDGLSAEDVTEINKNSVDNNESDSGYKNEFSLDGSIGLSAPTLFTSLPYRVATYPGDGLGTPSYINPDSLSVSVSEWGGVGTIENSVWGAFKGLGVMRGAQLLGISNTMSMAGGVAGSGAATENLFIEMRTSTYTANVSDWNGKVYFGVLGGVKAIDFQSLSNTRPMVLEVTRQYRISAGSNVLYTSQAETTSMGRVSDYIPNKDGLPRHDVHY